MRTVETSLLSALLLSILASCERPGAEPPPLLSQDADVEVPLALNELAERYGVEIVWEGGPYEDSYDWGHRSARDAAEWEIELFAPVLIAELSLYPVSFFQKGDIQRIVLVRDLWVEMEGVNQNISGQIFENREVFLSVSYTYKVNNRDKQRRAFHHLLWHHFDTLWGTIWEDPPWVALNPPGFEYGQYTLGGQHDRTPDAGLLSTDYPGFLNLYSTGTLPDDKADMFAYMMVAYQYVQARAESDPVIRAKMNAIKGRLADFDPDMDSSFWRRIEARKRDVTPYLTL